MNLLRIIYHSAQLFSRHDIYVVSSRQLWHFGNSILENLRKIKNVLFTYAFGSYWYLK